MWTKESSLYIKEAQNEYWIRRNNDIEERFFMNLFLGKKTNLLALKANIIESISSKLEYYRSSREKLYSGPTEYVSNCPITGINTEKCELVAEIYGAEYVQSPDTGHVFVRNRPTETSIHNFYLNDVTYAATYTDKKSAEFRLNNIAVPWLEWTCKVYKDQFGIEPQRILDVGSGAGHFVEACRRKGLIADGVELSTSSREFAKEIWDIELDGNNFLDVSDKYAGYDIVTFWGLLEHTTNPKEILYHANKIVSQSPNGGMVISKLPRWDSLSSASQRLNPETIIRHIDPMGHIMLFTDSSAAEMYYQCGFKPVSAWYYGMDVYETFMQLGNSTADYTSFINSGEFQMELQDFVDKNAFSDGLTLVGIIK